jgi:hypothetical protein
MLGGNETEAGYQPSLVQGKAHKFVVLSGCSGAGKSSLLSELGRRGFPIYEEPGRQVVKEQLYIGGDALPWANWSLFPDLAGGRGRAAAWRCRKRRMYVLLNGPPYGFRPVCSLGDAGLLRPREAQRVVYLGFRGLLWSRFSLRVSSRRLAIRLGRSHLGASGPAPLELIKMSRGLRSKAAPRMRSSYNCHISTQYCKS